MILPGVKTLPGVLSVPEAHKGPPPPLVLKENVAADAFLNAMRSVGSIVKEIDETLSPRWPMHNVLGSHERQKALVVSIDVSNETLTGGCTVEPNVIPVRVTWTPTLLVYPGQLPPEFDSVKMIDAALLPAELLAGRAN